MTAPRDPDRDLRLERLGDRNPLRHAHLGEAALVGAPSALGGSRREALAAYRALIDAVFTAPGAAEWLLGLWRRYGPEGVAPPAAPRHRAAGDAIRPADPGLGRA
jgi:hypothetical protein